MDFVKKCRTRLLWMWFVELSLLKENLWSCVGLRRTDWEFWMIFFFQTIRWCAQKVGEFTFTGLAQTPIYSESSLSECLYTRSSTITYNLTNQDTFTQFLCESGDTGLCGTGSAIQHVNITLSKLWEFLVYFLIKL